MSFIVRETEVRRVLAGEYVRPGMLSETDAVALGTRFPRDNVKEVFKV